VLSAWRTTEPHRSRPRRIERRSGTRRP